MEGFDSGGNRIKSSDEFRSDPAGTTLKQKLQAKREGEKSIYGLRTFSLIKFR